MTEPTVAPEANLEAAPEVKTFDQKAVDAIVQDRLAREREKYGDYDDLKAKVGDYEKQKEQLSQLELEKKQEYDKLKEGWGSKEAEYQNMLKQKDLKLQDMIVGNALNVEVSRQNAYPEASELIKSNVIYKEDGTVRIKGKDANGMDAELSVEEGVKQFLAEKQYLVKATGAGGSGTGSGDGSGGGGGLGQTDLATQLANAQASGDHKLVTEIKNKIRAKHNL